MAILDRDQLARDLERDEGLRLKPYLDSVGKLTIGIGRNLDDNGITEAEARLMLDHDADVSLADLDRNAAWWRSMPEPAQRGLANMAFNMGWPTLSGFRNMLAALEQGEYARAADEALDSRWARQVGPRSERIAELYRSAARFR